MDTEKKCNINFVFSLTPTVSSPMFVHGDLPTANMILRNYISQFRED